MIGLRVNELTVSFGEGAAKVTPVESVSFDLAAGEVLGLVGESGCGKSLTGLAILGLVREIGGHIAAGEVFLDGAALTRMSPRQLRELRGTKLGFVAQNPMTSLNPLLCVGEQVAEVAKCKLQLSSRVAKQRALETMKAMGIADASAVYGQFPHQLSGGLRQRMVIAGTLILDPPLIIADEPTTALDVSIQAQIIALLVQRARQAGSGLLLISHELGTVAESCDRVAVMYAGSIVEEATTTELFAAPKHPYTQALLGCVPRPGIARYSLRPINGEVPAPERFPVGCKFHPRCGSCFSVCKEQRPTMKAIPASATRVACHLYSEGPG